jgi:hypothetical protein
MENLRCSDNVCPSGRGGRPLYVQLLFYTDGCGRNALCTMNIVIESKAEIISKVETGNMGEYKQHPLASLLRRGHSTVTLVEGVEYWRVKGEGAHPHSRQAGPKIPS